jgi:hypothetical protein
VNDVLSRRHAAAIARTLGPRGRMVGYSKTAYVSIHSDHVVVFNANVCFAGGKVWWGDLDLTEDEHQLCRLSADTRETVYVLWETDARFDHAEVPLLDRAVYSVTPSGHTRVCNPIHERLPDGTLTLRGKRLKHIGRPFRPHIWPIWRVRASFHRREGARHDDGFAIANVLVGATEGRPCLALGCAWFSRSARGAWLEMSWYPSSQRRWAPRLSRTIRRTRGLVRPWHVFMSTSASLTSCRSASSSAGRTPDGVSRPR